LPLRTIFEHPSVAELAEKVDRAQEAQQGQADAITQALAMVGQLSADEVASMLRQRREAEESERRP
jgi:hypothetical protein